MTEEQTLENYKHRCQRCGEIFFYEEEDVVDCPDGTFDTICSHCGSRQKVYLTPCFNDSGLGWLVVILLTFFIIAMCTLFGIIDAKIL